MPIQLKPHEIHVWSTDLEITSEQTQTGIQLLSADERERAERYRLELHRQYFIAARAALRYILSLYLEVPPAEISFAYAEHQKPYLASPTPTRIQFNLAHSEAVAVYAMTLDHPVGIDIEKIQEGYNDGIAKRFFSAEEHEALKQLATNERTTGFYRLWARKEAIIKAIGKGLSIPLSSFSVSVNEGMENLTLENDNWTLLSLSIDSAFQTALASNQKIQSVTYWNLFNQEPKLINVIQL